MADGVITIPGQVALAKEGLFGPTWSGAKAALLVDRNPYNVTDTLGNHTEASFSGYSRLALPWGIIGYDSADPAGPDVSGAAVQQWVGPGDGSGQAIYGWAIIQDSESGSAGSSGNPTLLACGPLDLQPTQLNQITDILPLVMNLDWQMQAGGITQT